MSVYLFELGVEEIPSRFVPGLSENLEKNLRMGLDKHRIAFGAIVSFATYRRLAVQVCGLAETSTADTQHVRGPLAKISRDAGGNWLPPALGFLKRHGLEGQADRLRIETVQDADYLFLTLEIPAQQTRVLLPELVGQAVRDISLSVEMFWGEKQGPFVRPVHWMVSVLDGDVVPLSLFGIEADRYTYGHRFLTQNGTTAAYASGACVSLKQANDYEAVLGEQKVLVSVSERRKRIEQDLPLAVRQGKEVLLDEVTFLTEWPVVVQGKIASKYLHLPGQAISVCIEKNQRYFSLLGKTDVLDSDRDGVWIVADSVTPENQKNVLAGNMKVLNARLEDLLFFWEEDKKTTLVDKLVSLRQVTYQQGLGSLYDKSQRVMRLVEMLANQLGWESQWCKDVCRAAVLSKADQVTQMVMEMPELQGVMGSVYALRDGESLGVSQGLLDLYHSNPTSPVGALLAIADRADSLVACFRNGLIPTGSKDPWGLRREALRLIHALVYTDENGTFPFSLLSVQAVLQMADRQLVEIIVTPKVPAYFEACMTLCRDRFAYYLGEHSQGLDHDVISAVTADEAVYPVRQQDWARQLQQLRSENPIVFKLLVETAVRVKRLAGTSDPMCDPRLLKEPAEIALYDTVSGYPSDARQLLTQASPIVPAELARWGTVWVPVFQQFFDDVLVMAPDTQVRANRLGLLSWVNRQFSVLGDLEKIVL